MKRIPSISQKKFNHGIYDVLISSSPSWGLIFEHAFCIQLSHLFLSIVEPPKGENPIKFHGLV